MKKENNLLFYVIVVYIIIVITYIYFISSYSKVYDNITKEKCIEFNYSYYQGGLVILDNSYCYEINKGEKVKHELDSSCIRLDLKLNKDNCYFYRGN
jgi:hypothetical protein